MPEVHTYNSAHVGGWDQEDIGLKPAQGKYFTGFHFQNNYSKMDWRCGSIGRVPALQVTSCFGILKPWIQTPLPQKNS
jgi:hypothetical protein